jgi:hypothetical protein
LIGLTPTTMQLNSFFRHSGEGWNPFLNQVLQLRMDADLRRDDGCF